MIETILWIIFIGEIIWIALWFISREIGTPKTYGIQREVDLRLTYKRYMEIYPRTNITYAQYKRMQTEKAYRKAVSSTKIKRMVR
jgi:hypothetical protein